jgi:uncharacterized Zn-binding protein involved in type VI secretion
MGKPAARLGDMHVCPASTGTTPHVGGPISGPGVPTVLIGGQPAAVVGDMATCNGPPDSVAMGSSGVMIGGKPATRMGDQCGHGGSIVAGCPTVLIGERETIKVDLRKPSFIEFQVTNEHGEVVSNAEYIIELPGGTVFTGTTTEDGWMRIDGIDPGQCKITIL